MDTTCEDDEANSVVLRPRITALPGPLTNQEMTHHVNGRLTVILLTFKVYSVNKGITLVFDAWLSTKKIDLSSRLVLQIE